MPTAAALAGNQLEDVRVRSTIPCRSPCHSERSEESSLPALRSFGRLGSLRTTVYVVAPSTPARRRSFALARLSIGPTLFSGMPTERLIS